LESWAENDRREGNAEVQLRAGFVRVDITPADLFPMGGYMERTGSAVGTHDRLAARAVALSVGDTTAVLVALDLLCVSSAWVRKLKEAATRRLGIAGENVLVAATHTHSGPAVFFPASMRTAPVVRYEEDLLERCVDLVEQACASAKPSRMLVARVKSEGVFANRRDPHEPANDLVTVVRIESLEGIVMGHVVSVPSHPTVMGPSNLDYSADLFGACAAELEKVFEGSASMIFCGAAADASTRLTRREQTWAELDRLGVELAGQVASASRSARPARVDPVCGKTAVLALPFRKIPGEDTAQAEYERALKEAEPSADANGGSAGHARIARSRVEGAAAQLLLSRIGGWEPLFGADAAEVEVQVIRIGDIITCGLPGEFFGMRGRELERAAEPGFGFVAGYANGYWGYAVPPEEAARGGYEALMSPLEPSDEARIVDAAHALIHEIQHEN
jgi:hypothetical protein